MFGYVSRNEQKIVKGRSSVEKYNSENDWVEKRNRGVMEDIGSVLVIYLVAKVPLLALPLRQRDHANTNP